MLYEDDHGATPSAAVSPTGAAFAALSYDAVRFLRAAYASLPTGSAPFDRDALRQAILTTRFAGVTGAIDHQNPARKGERIVQIRRGRFELVPQ